MLRLTREVRMTLPIHAEVDLVSPRNSLAGELSESAGICLTLQVTLGGDLDPRSSYVENIRYIDQQVRWRATPVLRQLLADRQWTLGRAVAICARALGDGWQNGRIERVCVRMNPYWSCHAEQPEWKMIYLTQRFEFSAAHRLHNQKLSNEENRQVFGKCNNPAGHGHNYEFEVTLRGECGENGLLADPEVMAQIVQERVIARFDHKHLNEQTDEFAELIPSIENIAKVVFRLLENAFGRATLHSVRVWETGKTSAEYRA